MGKWEGLGGCERLDGRWKGLGGWEVLGVS